MDGSSGDLAEMLGRGDTRCMEQEQIAENLRSVRDRIAQAARRAGREPAEVTLVAVTKRNPARLVRPLIELGECDLGENYPQELWAKADEIADSRVRWHLIGHLQTNKAKRTVPLVRMIHAVDSLKLLRYLDALAAEDPVAYGVPVCLQVNTSGEDAKHGWPGEAILADADAIAECRHIEVAGLMTMAAFGTTAASARPSFAALRELRDRLRARTGRDLRALSMGMSNDFETAIEEGATLVRVGSALFEGVR